MQKDDTLLAHQLIWDHRTQNNPKPGSITTCRHQQPIYTN